MATPRSSAASVREQKLARVIDREVAPIWHDRFARLLLRELPANAGTFALDIHSGPGHTTAELLQRLDESSRVVALGRDPWLMQVSKMRVRPEWKRRVYFKAGDMDDVPAMAEATYDLALANLVLGEQVVDWKAALAELIRVTKPGGQVLATLPMHGTWEEVEDLFEELLRDEGMRREVATLQQLRRRRPKASQLAAGLRELGLGEDDVVVEHERFEMLFRSGREFLFAPVIEHGPLRLWKAILGRAEKPQALFWRFKEAIDTYYAGHVLAVSVVAGLIRVRVPGAGVQDSFAADYWGRYPSLARLWGAPGAAARSTDEDFDLDLDIDVDVDLDLEGAAEDEPADSGAALASASSSSFADNEVSGLTELPAVEDAALGEDPFAGLLEDLDAEAAAAAELVAQDAAAEAGRQAPAKTGRAATLGALEGSSSGLRPLPRKPGESGASPLPGRLPRKPGESGASPLPGRPPRKPGESGASPLPGKLPKSGKTGRVVLPGMPRAAPPPPRTGPVPSVGSPTRKQPTAVTKPGEDDPFASMLTDDEDVIDEIEPIDPIEELASLVDDEDGDISPASSSSGMRRVPPPPPPKKK
ncbi:MAG: class I SAM-dependent methyltransferase [Enhygromyxa sp.]